MLAGTAAEHNDYLMRKGRGPVPKPYRPKTVGDARRLIEEALDNQPWDAETRARYFELKGFPVRTANELKADETRIVLAAMEKSRIIIFAD